jgi:hypothetical protein
MYTNIKTTSKYLKPSFSHETKDTPRASSPSGRHASPFEKGLRPKTLRVAHLQMGKIARDPEQSTIKKPGFFFPYGESGYVAFTMWTITDEKNRKIQP